MSERSKQILPQFGRFWTVTPVLVRRWLQNDAHSLQRYIDFHDHPSNLKVTWAQTILTRMECFRTVTLFWYTDCYQMMQKA